MQSVAGGKAYYPWFKGKIVLKLFGRVTLNSCVVGQGGWL